MLILESFKLTCDVASVFPLLFTPSSFVHEQPLSATWFSDTARRFRSFATGPMHGWNLQHLTQLCTWWMLITKAQGHLAASLQ